MDLTKRFFLHIFDRIKTFGKWIILSIISGIIVGVVGSCFYVVLTASAQYRDQHPFILFALPIGGLIIAFLYKTFDKKSIQNTNLVISSIHSNEEIPIQMTPLIFISTVITHLCGGSAGREGAAMQLGGGLGNFLGKLLRLDDFDRRVYIMCGISAAFSTLFGTPIAAAIFSIEVVSVGIMYYSALVPCTLASIIAYDIAYHFGNMGEHFHVLYITDMTIDKCLQTILVAALSSVVSILFCVVMHQSEHLAKKAFKNTYVRILAGSCIILFLTFILNTTDYNGAGIHVMELAFRGEVKPEAFLLKLLFTAITLSCGFKGGEIVPSFFVGATFGCFIGQYLGISSSLCSAIGMISVFCGVTNCPITSLIISLEMFGLEGINYYGLAIAVSYMLSGYYGLYHSQKIIYSKYKTEYINTNTHEL